MLRDLDQGSVNAPPPLDHRDSGVGWSIVVEDFGSLLNVATA